MSINQEQGVIGPKMRVAWSLCAVLVAGLRYPSDALYAKQQTLDKFRFSKVNPRPQVPRELGHQRKVLSPGGKFEFLLVSNYSQDKVTDSVTTLQIAGGFIENAITLQNKVVIKVCYSQNCSMFHDLDPGIMALTTTIFKDEHMPDGEYVRYPYALSNQKHARTNKFDMRINMKFLGNMVRPVDYGGHGENMNFDGFETLIHEILHGMGFSSAMNRGSTWHPFYIGPRYKVYRANGKYSLQFQKSLFDMHLYSQGRSLYEIVRSMAVEGLEEEEKHAFIDNIPNLPQIRKINEFILGKEPVFFNTSSNKAVCVNRNKDQVPYPDSLGHLSVLDYGYSLDHLMVPFSSGYASVILNKTLVQFWETAPLGPNIVDILATLGYTKNSIPKREKSQLAFYEEMHKHNFLK